MELDDFDRRLLDAVQEDSRRTGEALAAMVGLSPAACLRRLQRLRAAGVIEREVAIVDPRFTPARLGLIVNVTLERERPDLVDDFARSMRRAPEVSQCYYVTGAVTTCSWSASPTWRPTASSPAATCSAPMSAASRPWS
jgi:Lrp/AsnC family leucine-responsive transcriptional regulator